MYKISLIDKVSFILVILGALVWLVFGIANVNIIESLLSFAPILQRAVYILVGLSGLNMIYFLLKTGASSK